MIKRQGCLNELRSAVARVKVEAKGLLTLVSGVVGAMLVVVLPTMGSAQKSAAAAPSLMFDGVTVVDVEHGTLVPNQRVVIAGNRIQSIGDMGAVTVPSSAQVVDARGKYLIPGLWDMHVHSGDLTDLFYPLFVANGVTGIRDARSEVPLDTLRQWRREILAGTRVGPPRQILSGVAVSILQGTCERGDLVGHVCVSPNDSADARKLVEALKAAGADMLKMYTLPPATYFMLAAAARRAGLPFGGHTPTVSGLADCSSMGGYNAQCVLSSAEQVSDSGASILDHGLWYLTPQGMKGLCWGDDADLEDCQQLAERLRRNGSWFTATLTGLANLPMPLGRRRADAVFRRFRERFLQYWGDTLSEDSSARARLDATLDAGAVIPGTLEPRSGSVADSLGSMYVLQRVGMPILAGTDVAQLPSPPGFSVPGPGFALHAELAMSVAEGLTPLTALQTATLNPAKFLHATDSLGTVAPGKLADLVLLDANPLADIANTTAIRAVVANGRYFDRAALDQLLVKARQP